MEPVVGGESAGSGAAALRAESLRGKVLSDRYRIVDLIAMGGIGAIYRAEHLLMKKEVAIKVLHPDSENFPELVARFEREAVAGAHIDHPNVASASDFGKFDGGSRFLVLELIKGMTLRDLIEKGPVPYARAASIVSQAAAGLGAAHEKGIIHRDVKPRNIMLHDIGGGKDVVKLIDFGLAKVPVEELSTVARDADDPRRSITQAGIVMGTVAYLAPEAALGMRAVRVPADLYSLGVVFYELLTGKHPFDAEKPVALFAQHRNTPPPPLAVRLPGLVIPPALEAVVMRLLAKDPDARFPDTKSLIEAIDLALDRGRPSPLPSSERTPLPSASTPPPRLRAPFENRRRSIGWVAAAGGIAAVVAVAAFAMGRSGSTPAPAASQSAPPTVTQAPVEAPPSSRPVATSAREQLRAANESNDPKRAAAAISDLAARDPAAFRDRAVQTEAALLAELVVTGDRQEADAVFAILESKLGADGLDVLYDLVSRESKSDPLERGGLIKPSGAPARARAILAKPDVIARASPAMRVALEIRSSQCQRRTFLFARAAKEGDDRALAILSAMQPPTCGPQGGGCCTKHPELDRAIAEIQARLRR